VIGGLPACSFQGQELEGIVWIENESGMTFARCPFDLPCFGLLSLSLSPSFLFFFSGGRLSGVLSVLEWLEETDRSSHGLGAGRAWARKAHRQAGRRRARRTCDKKMILEPVESGELRNGTLSLWLGGLRGARARCVA